MNFNLNESLETLKNIAVDAAQAAVKATRNAASVTRANINIFTEQEKQKKAFLELGKLYYRDFITGEEPDDAEYLPICDRITEAAKNIEAMRTNIEDIRGPKTEEDEECSEEEVCEEEKPCEEAKTVEETLHELSSELDTLQKELKKLDGIEDEAAETVEEAVFEVVDDEPKTEEAPKEE